MTDHELTKTVGDWLVTWQTMIAGVLALIGAAFTVIALNVQANREAERKCRGSRAMLPATVDAMDDYALDCVRWLESVREKAHLSETGAFKTSIPVVECPHPAADMIAGLRQCVENLGIGPSRYVSELLLRIQVQHSNVASLCDYFVNHQLYSMKRIGLLANIDDFVASSVEIAAFGRQLYPYARMETDGPVNPPELKDVMNAFRSLHLDDIKNVGAWNALTNRYKTKS